ncbi:MAG TPA: hypothetical protein PLS28_01410 [Clostridiales bacterium]|nr:hypothetical protein [Clostridiales bacterium]
MKQKKIPIFLLASLLFLLTFSGCGSSVPDEFKGKLMAPYIEKVMDGKYTYESSALGDTENKTTFTKVSNEKIMITIATKDTTAVLMRNGDNYYIVSPAQFAYTDATGDTKKQIAAYTTSLSIDNWKTGSFVEEGTCTVQGVEYSYEDYYIAVTQKRTRFLFNQDKKLALVCNVQEDGTIEEYLTMNIYAASEQSFEQLNQYHYYSSDGTSQTKTKAETESKTAENGKESAKKSEKAGN